MDREEATTKLREEAHRLGVGWFGVARADILRAERADLIAWLSEERHGDMSWLARDPERRSDPALVVPECRSVIVLGLNYLRGEVDEGPTTPGHGRISKYARTRDYHRVLEKILRRLARHIDEELLPGSTSRGYVDYGPVMERPWAVRAGLGFLGKHTLLIHPREGSFHFLAVLLTTADLVATGETEPFAESRGCGDCRRCLDACPTGAITDPWKLDARRCLSYLTIEKQGPTDPEFWSRTGGFVFGCDVCQDVCPYNRSRARGVEESPLGPALVPPQVSLVELLRDADALLERMGEVATPLKRAGADSLRRNALAAALASPTEEVRQAVAELAANPARASWLREMAEAILARMD